MKAGGLKIGYSEISTAGSAINSVARDGRPPCIQLGFCIYGCKIGAKWSTLYSEIPKAEATIISSFVLAPWRVKINNDASGKITGVVYVDEPAGCTNKKRAPWPSAGNVIETTRLLLNSASNKFPKRFGNSSGPYSAEILHAPRLQRNFR